ncbi:hypothetical protein F3Y22_tig00110346pilonHSYRG00039 [Hibiscus syriacus]|uniref:Vesicle transport protein n=1 Tax=Hibiscus syriacus TaxID=106335 RepID=A0A6A3AWW9_HIBSY|nr:hypothetical protein F3Y22_tig00110346pilonHSYRG00039 [Hibiscus syriacus]
MQVWFSGSSSAMLHGDGRGRAFQVPETSLARGRPGYVPRTCHGGRVRPNDTGDVSVLVGDVSEGRRWLREDDSFWGSMEAKSARRCCLMSSKARASRIHTGSIHENWLRLLPGSLVPSYKVPCRRASRIHTGSIHENWLRLLPGSLVPSYKVPCFYFHKSLHEILLPWSELFLAWVGALSLRDNVIYVSSKESDEGNAFGFDLESAMRSANDTDSGFLVESGFIRICSLALPISYLYLCFARGERDSRELPICHTPETGVFSIFIAFTMFLPVMVIMPQKFAICFTLGCGFIIGSFFALRGPKNQYTTPVIFVRLFYLKLVLALAYYAVSYFPGGSVGLKFLNRLLRL